jgi:hypothetical protein
VVASETGFGEIGQIGNGKSAYRLRLFTDNKRVYEDECGLNECIGLKSTVETRTSWTEANVFGTCVSYGC